jgi:RNA polymerase sigma-70 factor (ECF subfamily)
MKLPHRPELETDEQCARCAAGGCMDCFDALVQRFQVPLRHFLIRRVRSEHLAEDLVQETMLRAYQHLRSYSDRWSFRSWVFTIAYRLAVTELRRPRKGASPVDLEDMAIETGPSDHAVADETRVRLWDIARRVLEPDSFAALWLKHAESMSADEIGQVLDRSANAVRILLHRAHVRLSQETGFSDAKTGFSYEQP